MIHKYEYRHLTWIDLDNPTPNEVREIMETYSVHPLVAEELLTPNVKAKVDVYPHNIYMILHLPSYKTDADKERTQEIDFVIGKRYLITAHYGEVDALQAFGKAFEVNSILDKNDIGDHAGYIFYYMMKSLYRSLDDELAGIKASLQTAENKIFHGEERQMVVRLSEINRDILNFKDAITLHKEILTSFEAAGVKFFGEEFQYYLRDIIGEYYKVQTAIQTSKEFLEELRRTNDSLLSTKQNEVMKVFTVLAFIFLPLTFIGQLFGMSLAYIPLATNPDSFWIIIGAMAFLSLLALAFFKHKKWI